jgi:hypothetical protein
VRGFSSVARGASTRMRSLSSSSNVAASSAPLFASSSAPAFLTGVNASASTSKATK